MSADKTCVKFSTRVSKKQQRFDAETALTHSPLPPYQMCKSPQMPENLLLLSTNADVAAELETIVRFLGHELMVVNSMEQLSKAPTEGPFALAILDLDSGREMLDAIARFEDAGDRTPLFALLTAESDGATALAPGLAGSIQYPFSYRNLLGTIRDRVGGELRPKRTAGLSRELHRDVPRLRPGVELKGDLAARPSAESDW